MVITCLHCATEFVLGIDDEEVSASGVAVQCTRCGHAFTARGRAQAGGEPHIARLLGELNDIAAEMDSVRSAAAAWHELPTAPRPVVLGADDEAPTDRHVVPQRPSPPSDLLTEVPRVRQVPGESARRWFNSNELDLIVWLDGAGAPVGFQLCYDKRSRERALTWRAGTGFLHAAVDGGQASALSYPGAPVLDQRLSAGGERIVALFDQASERVPRSISAFVAGKLREYAQASIFG